MKKLYALLLAVLLLAGCAGPSSSSLSGAGGTASGSASASSGGPTLYTPDTVEEIPELAELHFSAALKSNVDKVSDLFWTLPMEANMVVAYEDSAYYLDNKYISSEHHVDTRDLLRYIVLVFEAEYPGALEEHGNIGYAISSDKLPAMIEYALDIPVSTDIIMDLIKHYEAIAFAYPTMTLFSVDIENTGNERRVTASENNSDKVITYVYKKEGEHYRLTGVETGNNIPKWQFSERGSRFHENYWGDYDKEAQSSFPYIEIPVTKLDNAELASQIIGNIGHTVLAVKAEPDRWVFSGLDEDTFEVKSTTSISGDLFGFQLYPGAAYLMLADRVVVLDENLQATSHPLPTFLKDIFARTPADSYEVENYPSERPVHLGGYTISQDLKTYAYSYEQGLFLYSTQTGTTQQISETSVVSWPGTNSILSALWNPFFSTDANFLYYYPSHYEFGPAIYEYNVRAWQEEAITNRFAQSAFGIKDGTDDVTQPEAKYALLGWYMGGVYYGENHYVWPIEYSSFSGMLYGRLTDGTYNSGLYIQPQFDYENLNEARFLTVLSDGRMILSADDGTNTHYYVTSPYSEITG